MGVRYYDPYTGRFPARDPIGGGVNWYSYANGNPVKFMDPAGQRPLTAQDRTRLRRLYGRVNTASPSYAVEDGLRVPGSLINASVRYLKAEIAAVPEGQGDPSNLRALWWAINRLGSANYGKAAERVRGNDSNWGKRAKCNVFVAHAYAYGADVGYGGAGVPLNRGNFPTSYDWGNPSARVANFSVVPEAQPGDIVAITGEGHHHVALKLGPGLLIYAGPAEAKVGTFDHNWAPGVTVTYRHYRW